MKKYISLVEFLESLGVKISLDWDDTIQVEFPDSVPMELVRAACTIATDSIKSTMISRRERRIRTCSGGPLHGKPHNTCWSNAMVGHESRGKWYVYHVMPDGRAIFRGYATSEKKARALAGRKSAMDKQRPSTATEA